MFEKYDDAFNKLDSSSRTLKPRPKNFKQDIEDLKQIAHSGIKLLNLRKIPAKQLDLNPSVDSTPREISVTSLTSSISSIFLSPAKLERVCQNKFGKVKEKVLSSNTEISQDFHMTSNDLTHLTSGNLSLYQKYD